MTTIHASGVSEAHYRAQRATVTARVSFASRDRGESIAAATALHNRIAQRAQQLRDSGDATWHSAEAPTTVARKTYAEGAKSKVIIEHVTTSRVRIKLSNLSLVAELVAELAEAGAETDVDWALTEAFRRECERRGRGVAVAEARETANDYAEALGERVVRVVSISDEQRYGGGQVRFAAAQAGGVAEVSIAEITVSVAVKGEFESE